MATYTRAEWGSAYERGGYDIGPVSEVYVHHFNSGITPPATVADSMARMRSAQAYHASKGWGDIGYSWCVDDAGNVYEGRGWGRSGAHTYGYNSRGYGICWLGDSNVTPPADAALVGIAACIRAGIAVGHITAGPTIVGHNDRVPDTACPGGPLTARLDRIRAAVTGGPTGGGDLTPDEHNDLDALATAWRVDIYAYPDGVWRGVNAGTPPPAGATATGLVGVAPSVAWAVEAATATRQLVNRVQRLEQSIAERGTGGGGATADQIIDALVARLAK